ncbi:hypothetical protein [Cyanobacterium sp. Dongsha4]|uniref:hypothetical protein n=1 Tax=Cyanobacterium sp. DS4 TaxID=2878255 RepID=UPI002E810854|nr:hypothetical protein [Cyanobacterium sp. Dongsha4]WVL00219.1 hypothetical protein Dongsha4_16435 [Cyanobacterium sp. Dongsha4]
MIIKNIFTLSLVTISFFLKINPTIANNNPIWEEEKDWITVVRNDYEVIKIRKGSIKQQGRYKTATFATLNTDHDEQGNFIMDKYYLSSIGQGYFDCNYRSNESNPANVDSVQFKNLKVFRRYKDGYLQSSFYTDDGSYYLRHQVSPLYHYICQDINPSYLKPGMSMFEVKDLLYKGGFKIIELEEAATTTNGPLCDNTKPCQAHGNNAIISIAFFNKKTRMYVYTGHYENTLYTVITSAQDF